MKDFDSRITLYFPRVFAGAWTLLAAASVGIWAGPPYSWTANLDADLPIRRAHLCELRSNINDAGGQMSPAMSFTWTDQNALCAQNLTVPVRLGHVQELRNAVKALYARSGQASPILAWTDGDPLPAGTPVRAAHLKELRAYVDALRIAPPCGTSGAACCATGPPCGAANLACSGGKCVSCGGSSQPCCPSGAPCSGAALTCYSGSCVPTASCAAPGYGCDRWFYSDSNCNNPTWENNFYPCAPSMTQPCCCQGGTKCTPYPCVYAGTNGYARWFICQ